MGTTTNNGWTYPESTDLVKDGATAIETLATDIDTTLGVYAPSTSGLELINTTSFSGVSSQSFNNVFSATYDNYRVIMDLTAGSNITMRLRVGGADNSTANYANQFNFGAWNNTLQGVGSIGNTSWPVPGVTTVSQSVRDFMKPFLATQTDVLGLYAINTDTGNWSSQFRASTSFDGFSIIGTSVSGTVSVYGFNK
jgi:hypothetical protein